MYEIAVSRSALKSLTRLPRPECSRILSAIIGYAKDPSAARHSVKALKGGEFHRLRVGNYRIVFEIAPPAGEGEKPTMAILVAGHRKDVYRRLK